MTAFKVLMLKEFRECWRSFKFLWIPIVFILLGVSDPLTNYYMEDILAAVGNMPEGFQMFMPELKPADLLVASTGQFQLIGLIVLIAVFVSSVSRERQNGTATLIYMRPVSGAALFGSKWLMATIVGVVSVGCGYAASMYYTWILYGGVSATKFAAMLGTYILWIMLVMAITLAMSACFRTVVAVVMAVVLVLLGAIIDSLIGVNWHYTPWKLVNYALSLLGEGTNMTHYWGTVGVVTILIVAFASLGVFATNRNRRLTKI